MTHTLFGLLLFTIFACNQEVLLHDKPKNQIACKEMPQHIYSAFDSSFKRDALNKIEAISWDSVINLSKNTKITNKSVAPKAGVRPGVRAYEIGKKLVIMKWNGNRENAPFIYSKGIIYYNISDPIDSEDDIKFCNCEYIDLRNELKIRVSKNDLNQEQLSHHERTDKRTQLLDTIESEIEEIKTLNPNNLTHELFSIQIKKLDSLLSINPREDKVLNLASSLYMDCNAPALAWNYLEIMEKTSPNNAQTLYNIGQMREQLDTI